MARSERAKSSRNSQTGLARLAVSPELELRAGRPPLRGQRGAAYDYNIKDIRERERRSAEAVNRKLTEGWTQAGPRRRRARTGAAREERPS